MNFINNCNYNNNNLTKIDVIYHLKIINSIGKIILYNPISCYYNKVTVFSPVDPIS